jgi:glycolate oxidase FAD binding subunit
MQVQTPQDEAELTALVEEADRTGQALVTEGSGTKRHWGPAAPAGARRICLRGLERVIAYEPADMILCVQAGARLRDVQRTLAAHNQWLPLDPPYAEATIGGILATNASGPRRLGHGTVKDLLLGVRVVGARGGTTKSGGRVVKNVSGYDLHRLQVGAFGSLGVIVEANFRVCARPEVSAIWALSCVDLGAAHRLLLEVSQSPLTPVALEALDAAEASLLRARTSGLPPGEALALVGIEGTRPIFERHARDLVSRGSPPTIVEGQAAARIWEALSDLPGAHAGDLRVRVGAGPHDLPGLLAALELPRTEGRGVTVRAAVGVAHVSLAAPDHLSSVLPLLARWQGLAAARGGYAVIESAPLDHPGREALPFGGAGNGVALGGAIRRAWDPHQTLNPGRMAW